MQEILETVVRFFILELHLKSIILRERKLYERQSFGFDTWLISSSRLNLNSNFIPEILASMVQYI